MKHDFTGRRVLVTGAASGIGRATAKRVAHLGAHVIVADISVTGALLAEDLGGTFVRLDVTDPDSWAEAMEHAGEVHHAHLNAGIMTVPPDRPLAEADPLTVPLERYRKVMAVNVDGVVLGVRAVVPRLHSGGSITATASLAGLVPIAFDPFYALTKHAVVGFVRSMAPIAEDQGWRINAICPTGVDTAIIPDEMRTADSRTLPPEMLAEDVTDLLLRGANGEIRGRISPRRVRSFDPPDLRDPG